MTSKKDISSSTKRLEQMKDATLTHYLAFIDLDNDLDLYDTMIHLFVDGKLDEDFYSPMFQDMDSVARCDLQELVREYISLCFFAGNPDYWTDSIEGLSLMDLDLICMKIFDNYNFLLELAKDGGEDVLKQLKELQKTPMFSSKVVIDYLRNCFDNDEILESTLIEISKKDGNYQGLSDVQKANLLLYPEGVLYVDSGDSKKRLNVSNLEDEIRKRISSNRDISSLHLNELIQLLGNRSFSEVITDIYLDYMVESVDLEEKAVSRTFFEFP